ncbi:MAG: S41 family peptidase [Anaerovoracaceae bacterium]|jgi:carboxyl-terminal processing protease
MNIKKRSLSILIIAAVLCGALGCYLVMQLLLMQGVGEVKITQTEYQRLTYMDKKYSKAEELMEGASKKFYKDISEEELLNGLYKGIFLGLDDVYSSYMTKEEYESWMATTLGEFEGIGVTFNQDNDGNFVLLSTSPGSPAEKGGLKAGDIITMVDDKTYDNADTIGAAMRGEAGTEVKITYLRDGKENSVNLTRATIVTQSVTSEMLEGNIGYIKITGFEEATAKDFKKALADLEVKTPKGLIIDIRDNGGGLVTSGTQIADLLVGKGTITYLQDRDGKKEYIDSDEKRTNIPYVVLINENSASTSEILAAAVKDNGPGKLVGVKTYGKGVVQSTTKLEDGSAYKLTIMQYYSPKGDVIHGKGVTPDYEVKGEDAQLKKAIELLTK